MHQRLNRRGKKSGTSANLCKLTWRDSDSGHWTTQWRLMFLFFSEIKQFLAKSHCMSMRRCRADSCFGLQIRCLHFCFLLRISSNRINTERQNLHERLNAQLKFSYFVDHVSLHILISVLQKTCVCSWYLQGIALVCVFAGSPGSHLTQG